MSPISLYAAALRGFLQALQAAPQDETALRNCADVLAATGQGKKCGNCRPLGTRLLPAPPETRRLLGQ